MRPYLAVIKDSFREAFASRVLWVLLILITLFLLVIAPCGYRRVPLVRLFPGDIRDSLTFVEKLVDARGENDTPAGHIAGLLSDNLNGNLQELKDTLQELVDRDRDAEPVTSEEADRLARLTRDTHVGLYRELNRLFYTRDFYDHDHWSDVELSDEAQELLAEGVDNLGDVEVARLNRLAFDAAFAGEIDPADGEAVAIDYLHWEVFEEVPLEEALLQDFVSGVLTTVVTWLVGVFGVIIALIVTAFIVPRMLDAGSVDLLLSKPVSRPLLLISKFFGGCAFILLCTTYLNTGVWLIIGLRFGVWNTGLLWAILVFVFVFAIYYSVSTLAAMLWRSAIVSIICSVLFWGLCFSVGSFKGYLETWWLDTQRTAAIMPGGDTLFVTNWEGVTSVWDDEQSDFVDLFATRRETFAAIEGYPFLGPYYDAQNDRLVGVQIPLGARFPPPPNAFLVASADDDWSPASVGIRFDAKSLMLDADGSSIVAGLDGIFRLRGDPTLGLEDLNLELELTDDENSVSKIDAGTLPWRQPFDAALDPKSGRIAVISGKEVVVLEAGDDGIYEVADTDERDGSGNAVVAIAGDVVLVAEEDGVIHVLNRSTLTQKEEFESGHGEPRDVIASPDGRWFAVPFKNRELWVYDADAGQPIDAPVRGGGDISAVAFGPDNTLYVGDRFGRIIQYRPGDDFSEVNRWERQAGALIGFYRWFMHPVYILFPKPGEMDNLIGWLMTRQAAPADDEETEDEAAFGFAPEREVQRSAPNIWQPLWSNTAFLAVMLGLTSYYFTRKEF